MNLAHVGRAAESPVQDLYVDEAVLKSNHEGDGLLNRDVWQYALSFKANTIF